MSCFSIVVSHGLGGVREFRREYHSLVFPFLIYGATIWGNTYEATLHPIIGLQKKAVRIITFSPYREHTFPIFKDLNIMKFLSFPWCLGVFLCLNFLPICYLLPSLISLPLYPQGTSTSMKQGLLPDRRFVYLYSLE